MSVLASLVIGVGLFALGSFGWIWANLQGGFNTPVLHRPSPWPWVTLAFSFVALLGPTVFCVFYPAFRAWRSHSQVWMRIFLVLSLLIAAGLDMVLLHAYVQWVYALG